MAATVDPQSGYGVAFLDWLACACAGREERAAVAMRALGDEAPARVAFAGAAGHVLDYDDTLPDGVAHVSAACAPAALVLADELGLLARRHARGVRRGLGGDGGGRLGQPPGAV